MASTAFSEELAKASLSEEGLGFFELKDSVVGDGVRAMEERGFKFNTEDGLEFGKQHVLNSRVMPVIESFFGDKPCVLAHWLRYIAYPGHFPSFRSGGPAAGRCVLVVFLIAKGSRITYWGGSHRVALPVTQGQRYLPEASESDLIAAGCQKKEETYHDGGLTISDARLHFGIEEGMVIAFEFATPEVIVIGKWPKMQLPDIPELKQKVADMGSSKIGTNFEFIIVRKRKRERQAITT